MDVYRAYADARASFMYANEHNYGDLEGSGEINHLFVKAFFLKSAILHYGLCLDLCWQVIWAYLNNDSMEYLLKNDYERLEKECNSEAVFILLNKHQDDEKVVNLRKWLSRLNSNDHIMALRKIYNTMKHRGSLRIKEVDDATEVTTLHFLGQDIDSDIRPEYTIEEVEKIIYDYHRCFYNYFTLIIGEIIPEDYLNSKVDLTSYIQISSKIRETMIDVD